MHTLIDVLLAAIGGFVAHRTRPTLQRDFGNGWFVVACYAIGVLVTLPFYVLLLRHLGRRNGVGAFLLSFFGVGAGVVAGHYLEPD